MAKDKKAIYPICNESCNSAVKIDNIFYCKLKLKDEKVAKSSGIIFPHECMYFRKATKSNTKDKLQK